MRFIMVDGKGDPNTSPFYKEAVEVLYGLSYFIKMNKGGGTQPEGYFDYVVPPLEGLWWFEGKPFDGSVIGRKEEFNWVMMIRQPEFVTTEVFENAKVTLLKKKPKLNTSIARLEDFTEGLCAQIMHIGKNLKFTASRILYYQTFAFILYGPNCTDLIEIFVTLRTSGCNINTSGPDNYG
jgi:hypothetical protein